MQSQLFQRQLKLLSLNQSTRPYVGLIEQRNLVVCFPPPERQERICAAHRERVAAIDTARHRILREIELLHEYRTRLTADVVTGKLDVREAAGRLPDEDVVGPEIQSDAELADEQELAEEVGV
jgi:type I restriction enzyme, S subunit